jgi:hypothetical protein
MKKQIIAILLLFTLTSCVENISTISTDSNQTDSGITIDIDEELELLNATGLRDDEVRVVEEPIYIGDNDEVSFKGNAMQKKSPLKIKVGNKKEIEFSGYRYTIKTMELKNGDSIVIKDRDGNVFVNVKVVI